MTRSQQLDGSLSESWKLLCERSKMESIRGEAENVVLVFANFKNKKKEEETFGKKTMGWCH